MHRCVHQVIAKDFLKGFAAVKEACVPAPRGTGQLDADDASQGHPPKVDPGPRYLLARPEKPAEDWHQAGTRSVPIILPTPRWDFYCSVSGHRPHLELNRKKPGGDDLAQGGVSLHWKLSV